MPKQALPPGHFEMADAAAQIGVTKNTIWRWEKLRRIEPPLRDRNGHRIFTTEMIEKIKTYKNTFTLPTVSDQ